MWTLVAAASLPGCAQPEVDSGFPEPADTSPRITEATVSCDGDAGKWAFDVHTDAWTGGGTLWMSTDGVYVEKSSLGSVAAAEDGSADELKLSLTVVSDFGEVSAGSSTVFNCGTSGVEGLFVVKTRTGDAWSDCRVFGDDAGVWTDWSIATCTTAVDVTRG